MALSLPDPLAAGGGLGVLLWGAPALRDGAITCTACIALLLVLEPWNTRGDAVCRCKGHARVDGCMLVLGQSCRCAAGGLA
jgi:hypothetical protein